MGLPVFRFRLIHDIEGTFTISEPDGWKDAKIRLERHEDFHSLVEFFSAPLRFYGSNGQDDGGINVIRFICNSYGFDAKLTVDVDVSFDGTIYEDIYTGLYDFTSSEETNRNIVKSAIIQQDFWAKFISRRDTPIDIQSISGLDGGSVQVISPFTLPLSPQKVPMAFQANSLTHGILTTSANINAYDYYQIAWDDIILEEIEEYFSLPQAGNTVEPVETFNLAYKSEPIVIHIETDAYMPKNYVGPEVVSDYFWPYININGVETAFTLRPNPFLGKPSYAEWEIDISQNANIKSEIKVYFKKLSNIPGGYTGDFQWNGRFQDVVLPGSDIYIFTSTINLVGQTLYPETTADGFLTHDVGRSVIDRITDVNDSLVSDFLGGPATNPDYSASGCGYKYINVKGLQLRKYSLSQKPFFQSFNQWWNGINPILNLGLGYEVVNGRQILRIEDKASFFVDTIIVTFDYVFDIIKRFDNDSIFNKIDIGYKKWESEQFSGIDDAQTKRTYATRLQKSGKSINIESEFIAASLAIEETRRQTIKKTKDYKLDNDTFIIAVDDSEFSPGQFLPELDENFTSITNLLNPDTRYNSRLTPARNLLRWANYLNGCLQSYLTSVYRFVSGEGNYDMTSDLIDTTPSCDYQTEVSEKQDIGVTEDYLHLPDLFEININMDWDQYVAIRDNRSNAIGISQTASDHVPFFIKELDYELCKSKAKIICWPKTPFNIVNTDFVPPATECVPAAVECSDAYLTELSEILITEDENCLILE